MRMRKIFLFSLFCFPTACGVPGSENEFGMAEQPGLNSEAGTEYMSKSIGMYKGNSGNPSYAWSADCTATLIGRDSNGYGCYLTAGHCSSEISYTKRFAYKGSSVAESCANALRNSSGASCTSTNTNHWAQDNDPWAEIAASSVISTSKGTGGTSDFMIFRTTLSATDAPKVYKAPTSSFSGAGKIYSTDWENSSTGYDNYPDEAGPRAEWCNASGNFSTGLVTVTMSDSCSSSGQNSGGPFIDSSDNFQGVWSNTGPSGDTTAYFHSAIFQRGHIASLMRGSLGCTAVSEWPYFCDINKDAKVDLTDFHTMKTGSGTSGTFTQGNCDGSGNVDSTDYGLLKANFGT